MTEKTVKKPRTKRLLSLFLAVVMLVTAQGFITYADTVSQNDTKAPLAVAENDAQASQNVDQSTAQSVEKNTAQDVEIDEEQETVLDVQTQAATPANPVHHCTGKDDGTDTTTWSYVYFGSYPQSEVTDQTTIAAIDSAIAAGNGAAGADNTGTDVWVNGTKYRRISEDDTNNSGYFDEVENNAYRYFKWERIKWRVLDNNDNGTLFVMADKALDCKCYNDEYTSITWENSTIRNWLNNSFYNTAFSSSEQNAIIAQTVVNEDNPYYGTDGEDNTTDKVYLLSIGEVTNEDYGFCSDYSTYSVSRRLQASSYANARGTRRGTSSEYEGNCWWWLRSPGNNSTNAAYVHVRGHVRRSGYLVNSINGGAVPALHINLSSDLWSMADDGSSGAGTAVQMTSLSIKAPSKKLAAGKKVKLSVDVKPLDATNQSVTWEISNKKYASIDQSGKLTLKKTGAGKTVTVTARAADGSGVTASYKIKIMKHAVKSVKLKTPSKTLKSGKSMTVKATIKTTGKSVNKTLKWQSSDTKYATVNNKGKVTAKKAGKGKTVTITVMSTDGSNKKATVKIKIK